MSNIVKTDSKDFDSIYKDIVTFLSIPKEINLSDFYVTAIATRFATLISDLYLQCDKKDDIVRRESTLYSALRADSIKYLAISQSNYSPKRKVAPQQIGNDNVVITLTIAGNSTGYLDHYVFGQIEIDSKLYSLSIIKKFEFYDNDKVSGKIGIGQWRQHIIELDSDLGHLDQFNTFHIDEESNVIDDSQTVEVFVVTNTTLLSGNITGGTFYRQKVINNINELTIVSDDELKSTVLVTTNFHGGIDLNFGDGKIFGNGLYSLDNSTKSYIVINYFVTQGFIPNLILDPSYISWDSKIVESATISSYSIANGVNEEDPKKIKTLAPANNVAQYKITTPQDLYADFGKIPTVKSCFCIRDTDITNWNSTSTFYKGDVIAYDSLQYVCINDVPLSDITPLLDTTNWMKLNQEARKNNATLVLAALVASGYTLFGEKAEYDLNEIVYQNGKFYKCMVQDADSIPEELRNNEWEITKPLYFQQLTQPLWELNFFYQQGYNRRLGFLQVRIANLIPKHLPHKLKVVLDNTIELNNSNTILLNNKISEIIRNYEYQIGILYDFGSIVSSINKIQGIKEIYFEYPIQNYQLKYNEYLSSIDLKVSFTNKISSSDKFGLT